MSTRGPAACCLLHQVIVSRSPEAPERSSRFLENDPSSSPSSVNATDPKESIEFGPGMGPSDSMSVLTYISRMKSITPSMVHVVMKLVTIFAVVCLMGCSGCKSCNKVENPPSPEYPCGSRAHPCSLSPLLCCWNTEVCGGPDGTGCPTGMCCAMGEDYSIATNPPMKPTMKPGVDMSPQWSIGHR